MAFIGRQIFAFHRKRGGGEPMNANIHVDGDPETNRATIAVTVGARTVAEIRVTFSELAWLANESTDRPRRADVLPFKEREVLD